MEMVFAKPAEGGRIRMPDRGSIPMPAEGMAIPRNNYYERLIATGDLVVDQAKTDEFNAGHKEAMEAQAAAVVAAAKQREAEVASLADRQPTILPAKAMDAPSPAPAQSLGDRHKSPPPPPAKK